MPTPRPELQHLELTPHGGDAAPGCVDFSTGVSPLPPPEGVLEAFRAADVRRYPHPTALPLRDPLAGLHGMPLDGVVVGNGSVELIWALARAFAGPGRSAVVLAPAFGEYAQAVRASGASVEVLAAQGPPFEWSLEVLLATLRRQRPSLLFVCRPSNPCLAVLPMEAVRAAAAASPETLVVVDEAYLPLFEGVQPVHPGGNVVVLRSLTKVFALPGLRLGYLLGEPQLLRAVQASLPPWNVSAPALAAGRVALECLGQVDAVRAEVARLRAAQESALVEAGARVDATGGTFLLCRVSSARTFAAAAVHAGIRVRDCTSLGLPHHIRVGVRPEADHPLLRAAWRRVRETLE
ncbi:histidinol-phosphate transaminase [Vitiosangium sp. GDMCC 1.1324]|uniref:pyridoxal phosphate-dependent aminotransferase n=1 Tax=Vitiosangium sp. (strain GDMCC 1.1324) TaxID=2138576 RepID=UPI00130D84DD|nr:histidinol-phosphate transaminase [Vitiosangium sp. GDMCC 1.1324]